MDRPLTDLDLDDITARAAHLYEHATTTVPAVQADFDQLAGTDTPALVAEVRRLRTRTLTPGEYNAAWHAVEGAAGEEGADPGTVLHAVLDRLGIEWQTAATPAVSSAVPRPSAQHCNPPHVRAARYDAAGNVMAASLVRDGFGDDEIANMLRPAGNETAVPRP